MSINQWVYEKATGKWMVVFRDASVFPADSVNFGIVDLGADTRPPDPVLERCTGVTRRAATAAEITDSLTDQQNALASDQFSASPAIKAALFVALWTTLGHQPTAADIATAKTRFITVYKSLL